MKKSNLENFYKEKIINTLSQELKISNKMEIPKLNKIVLNMGLGDAKDNKNSLKQAVEELSSITGQKPIIRKSKKAISNFKIRQNDPVGLSVTLRKKKMYEFLERFIAIVSPRIRDFRGFSPKGFDGRGNY
uniref:large ribosomal subunit protein uL5 n=1 Tax=Zunongwangia profunda TaxID=398743 RepID=UPI0023A79DF0